jgi:hypothetical protein
MFSSKAQAPCIALLLVLCVQSYVNAQEPTRKAATADVYEAVIRYQIQSWDRAASSYCIMVNNSDAEKVFLSRFNPLRVKRASDCRKKNMKVGKLSLMNVVDRATGQRSVIFDLDAIRWVTETEAIVEGGYECASQCMAGGNYHVIYDGTHWVVTGYEIHVQA